MATCEYEYKVITDTYYGTLENSLRICGWEGWKLVNVVWNSRDSLYVATLIREKDNRY